jgi:hypothetical protein
MTYRVATSQTIDFPVAATSWVVNHNVPGYPIVDVYVDISGTLTKIIPQAVTYNTTTQVTISFSTPFSGKVVIA